MVLPLSMRQTLSKTNWIQTEKTDQIPQNCLVVLDDEINSVLSFLLGFIAFKQSNFERTQIFCRSPNDLNIRCPLFFKNRPSV